MAVYRQVMYVLMVLRCYVGSVTPTLELTTSEPSQPTSQPTTSTSVQLEGTLFCGDSVTGSTTASQRIHYYRFTTPPYIVSVLFDSCGSAYDTYLYFNEPNGTPIGECDDCGSCGNRAQLPGSSVSSGDYVLGIGGYSSGELAYSDYGVYSMSVTCSIPTTCCDCVTEWDNFCSPTEMWCCEDVTLAPDNFCVQDPACLAIICAKNRYCCDSQWSNWNCAKYAWLVCEMQTVFDSTARPAINTSLANQIEGTLFCGDSVTGSTTPSHHTHYYRFTTPPYTVSVLFSYDTCDSYFNFKEMDGTVIAYCDISNCDGRCGVSPVHSGDYLLAIGVVMDCGAYVLSVRCNDLTTFRPMQTTADNSTVVTVTVPPSDSSTSRTPIISSNTLIIIIIILLVVILMLSAVYIRRLKRKVKHYKSVRTEGIATNEENEGCIEGKKKNNDQ